jgi:tetratricopeptide (TPR) repeat protein
LSDCLLEQIRILLADCLNPLPAQVDGQEVEADVQAQIACGMRLHNWHEKAEAFRRAACLAGGVCAEGIPAVARFPLALWAFNKSAALSRPSPAQAELHYLAYFWLTDQDPDVATQTAPTYPHGLKYYFSLATVGPGAPYLPPLRTDAPIDVLRRLALHPRPEVVTELRRMAASLALVSPGAIEGLKAAARSRSDYTLAQRQAVLSILEPAQSRQDEMRCLLDEAARIARTNPMQALGLVQRACALLDSDETAESEDLLRELARGASRVGDLGLAGRALVQVYLAAEKARPGEEMVAEGALLQRLHDDIKRAGGGAEGALGQFISEHPGMREDLHLDDILPECPLTPEEAARSHARGVAQGPNNEEAAQCFRLAAAVAAGAPGASLDDFKHYVASFYASSARLNFRRGRWEEAERCYLMFFSLLYGDEVLRARIQPIIVPVLKYFLSLSFRSRRTLAHVPVDRDTSPMELIARTRAVDDEDVNQALDDLLAKLEQANPLIAQELREPDARRHVFLADSQTRSPA